MNGFMVNATKPANIERLCIILMMRFAFGSADFAGSTREASVSDSIGDCRARAPAFWVNRVQCPRAFELCRSPNFILMKALHIVGAIVVELLMSIARHVSARAVFALVEMPVTHLGMTVELGERLYHTALEAGFHG